MSEKLFQRTYINCT